MRSLLKACIVSLCVIGFFTACKKDSPDGGDPSGSNTPENIIRYRTMDLQVTTPTVVIGEMVSNTYKDGWGQMEFTGPVTSIPDNAFQDNTSLVSIELSNKVGSIGAGAFKGCSNLLSITTGNGIKTIGRSAFSGCSSLKEFAIADGIIELPDYVFNECTNLETVYLGKGLTKVSNKAFLFRSKVSQVHIKDLTYWCESGYGWHITLNSNVPVHLYQDGKEIINLTIPESVKTINNYAFAYCTSIKSVIIPESVIGIGKRSFSDCSSLERVSIPSGIVALGISAFEYCGNLKRVDIPSIDAWLKLTFTEDTDSYSGAANNPFEFSGEGHLYVSDKEITEITIPDGFTKVGDFTFVHLKNLASVTIPDSVQEVGVCAFENCKSLQSILIPDKVTKIDASAFRSSGIKNITLGSGVTTISYQAFRNCENLETIKLRTNNPPRIYTDPSIPVFDGCNKLSQIIVPVGSLQSYKSAKGWSSVSHLIVEE